jgi:ankyrin repeat protein
MTSNLQDEVWKAIGSNNAHRVIEILQADTGDQFGVNTSVNPETNKPLLHEAANSGHLDVVQYLIEQKGLDPNAQDPFNRITALHLAARANQIDMVAYLLGRGVDVNIQDRDNYTAMHYAALNGNRLVVELLLQVPNIDVNLVDYQQRSPLHRAVEQGFTDIAHELIVKAKAAVNLQNNHGWTALHYASYNQKKVICEVLLKHGAIGSIKDRDGKQALFWGYGHWNPDDKPYACGCPHPHK